MPPVEKRAAKRSRVDVAVFPVAGRGTRFLPATKASPKEMLPIVDKPLIQYAVEEALEAGARRLVFITGSSKRAIEDHFDSDGELENLLLKQGKSDLLKMLKSVLPSYASCIYIRQPAPLGLGHAVLCAKPAVGNAPFYVHLADDLIDAEEACLKQMSNRFDDGSIVAVQTVPHNQTDKYGIVKTGARRADLLRVEEIVEKPKPSVAPSNLAVVGRYLLTPRVFTHLEKIGQGAGGEIQLTDGIARLMNDEVRVCVPVRRQAFRLRQQARLSAGQRGIRTGASGAEGVVQDVPEEAVRSSRGRSEITARPVSARLAHGHQSGCAGGTRLPGRAGGAPQTAGRAASAARQTSRLRISPRSSARPTTRSSPGTCARW